MNRSRPTSRARRWLAGLSVLSLVGALGLIPAASVAAVEPANPVLDWNINAINAIANPVSPPVTTPPTPPGLGQPPPLAVIHLAMVQGAVYDAVNAIDGGHEPYLTGLPSAPAGASKAAAVATAAHDVLVALPAIPPASPAAMRASVDELYGLYMLGIDDGAAKNQGVAIGAAAAAAMIAERDGDGRLPMETWPIGTVAGEWQPVAPQNANIFAQIGDVEPFTLASNDQFRTEGPPDMASAQYAAEFNEVKTLGSNAVPTARTEAQSSLAGFISGNPFGMYNRALREIAAANGLSTTEQALLFGKTTISTADALIACWNDKDAWKFWRPQTAIRAAADDGNPATVADPNWTSLSPNPGYPDHPSGYNCFAGGTWQSVRAFFGTDQTEEFQLTSGAFTRSYTRFTDVVDDAIDGRVYIGIQFRSADVQAAWIGKKVAQWVDKHYFAPVD
jgi:hypothetical protein